MGPPDVQNTEICCEFFWIGKTRSVCTKISGALSDRVVAEGLPTLLSTPLLVVLIQLRYLDVFVNKELLAVKSHSGNDSNCHLR
jgi:hypothetical protein